MKTILLLPLVAVLLAGCASGPPPPTTTVARDARGNLVLEPIQRSDDYYPATFPSSFYSPPTQKHDWPKSSPPKFNIPK